MQQPPARRSRRSAATGVAVAAAAVLSGCAATDGLMTSLELPAASSQSAAPTDAPVRSVLPAPGPPPAPPPKLIVTAQQRNYLDALRGEGVRPSSELLALSIGSYVCQARAARQSPQAVWDFVRPLVNGDIRNAHPNPTAPSDGDVDAVTGSYIRIASERLC